jgi:hypothetical protein
MRCDTTVARLSVGSMSEFEFETTPAPLLADLAEKLREADGGQLSSDSGWLLWSLERFRSVLSVAGAIDPVALKGEQYQKLLLEFRECLVRRLADGGSPDTSANEGWALSKGTYAIKAIDEAWELLG